MKKTLTYEDIRNDSDINAYIEKAGQVMSAMGYTEHSFAHVTRVAESTGYILQTLGYDERTVEIGKIAGYMHDIGNMVNRHDHSQSGALVAFTLLKEKGMPNSELVDIVAAIGNHDEHTGLPLDPVSAALIIADKADVRRTRVKNPDLATFDIHDRVNYSVQKSELKINSAHTLIKLKLQVDTHYSSVIDYFEIFMTRMILCRKAADVLGMRFTLMINEQQLI